MNYTEHSTDVATDVLRKMLFVARQARRQMEEQVVEKSSEVEQYWQRLQELENMYSQLKEALEDERQAKQDEEALRTVQARYGNRPQTHTCPFIVRSRACEFCSQAAGAGGEEEARAGGDLQATAAGSISVSEGERRSGEGAIGEGTCPAGCTRAAGESGETETGSAGGVQGDAFIYCFCLII